MSYRTIREAQKTVWPRVRESLDRHRASREAVANDPFASSAAQTRAKVPWNRVVADETVWAIAKADLLSSPDQAAVLTKARNWARDVGRDIAAHPQDFEHTDRELYRAIQAWLATLEEIPDDIG